MKPSRLPQATPNPTEEKAPMAMLRIRVNEVSDSKPPCCSVSEIKIPVIVPRIDPITVFFNEGMGKYRRQPRCRRRARVSLSLTSGVAAPDAALDAALEAAFEAAVDAAAHPAIATVPTAATPEAAAAAVPTGPWMPASPTRTSNGMLQRTVSPTNMFTSRG